MSGSAQRKHRRVGASTRQATSCLYGVPNIIQPLSHVCVCASLGAVCLYAQDGQELVFTYHNMLKSEAVIMQAIRDLGPFDGICGFSQVGGQSVCCCCCVQSACSPFAGAAVSLFAQESSPV